MFHFYGVMECRQLLDGKVPQVVRVNDRGGIDAMGFITDGREGNPSVCLDVSGMVEFDMECAVLSRFFGAEGLEGAGVEDVCVAEYVVGGFMDMAEQP